MALPDIVVQVAFNADPHDPTATRVYTDLSTRLRSIASAQLGRPYEIDEVQTGQMSGPTWKNVDEYLNPANASSPYFGQLLPYRGILVQAMYPAGGTGNLMGGYAVDGSHDGTFESYLVGSSPGDWVLTTGGVTPTVSSSTPQQGSRCLSHSVAGSGIQQGVGWTVTCIPGRQYTASAYVRQTAANTTRIFINGGAVGTSTTTTGAYVRLSVTWTASQPTHQVWVSPAAPLLAGTVLLDAWQVEPGAAASTFTISGPTLATVWDGYVERWPATWTAGGIVGQSDSVCVDMLSVLANTKIGTEVRNATVAAAPAYYWQLNEAQGTTAFGETSGNSGPPLVAKNSKNGPGIAEAGTATDIPGDPQGSGVGFTTVDQLGGEGTCLQAGLDGTPGITAGGAQPNAVSLSAWVRFTGDGSDIGGNIVQLAGAGGGSGARCTFWQLAIAGIGPGTVTFGAYYGLDPLFATYTQATADVARDTWHHLVAVTSTTAAGATTDLYVDGALADTSSVLAAAFPGGVMPSVQAAFAEVGGVFDQFTSQFGVNATIAHVAVWRKALTAGDVAALALAGTGYPGETSGQRIARYLGYGWSGPTDIDTGASVMGVATVTSPTSILAAVQSVTTSENGLFYAAAGVPTFRDRTDRTRRLTASRTFGGHPGELPFVDLAYSLDPGRIFNQIEVSRVGGVRASASDAASIRRYFERSLSREIAVASDLEAVDAANWLRNQHKDPAQRISAITINPLTDPDRLWPVVLTLRISDRVTVTRRPALANGGTGITITGDYFVENIEHHDINPESGAWLTTLLLSPASGYQAWILGDATYGVLDSTTILGY